MKKLLEDAILEHENLLEEAGVADTCWDSYENSSIVQLFHQVKVKLEKEKWSCDYTQEPFMKVRGKLYKLKVWVSFQTFKSIEDGSDVYVKKGDLLKYVGLEGSFAELYSVFENGEGNRMRIRSYLFIEEFFEMIQKEVSE
ncbi:hypothetical protein [Breznakia pachnodae]|uniref:Uncharacterized protein n=1 Tax=Breznakia pachnodae TaxID=265178 RepID=A0ABU0E6M6_9FIRM|nr:hypothetical protein [Breznakia pachnodae]MDQ0362566.1 hypothetical protein [Breznakia pachnodae]